LNASSAQWNIDRFFNLALDYGFFGLYLVQSTELYSEVIDLSWNDLPYVLVFNRTEISGDYKVKIHLNIPYDISSTFAFMYVLSPTYHADFALWPLRADNIGGPNWTVAEDLFVGTGGYIMDNYDLDNGEISFTRYEDYWGGTPYVEQLVFAYYSSEETLQTALMSKEVDLVGAPKDPALIESTDYLTLVSAGAGIGSNYVVMYDSIPVDVRKAFNYAFDRDYFIEEVDNNRSVSSGGAFFKGVQYHNDAANPPGYDLVVARQAMVDSGLTSDTDVTGWTDRDWSAKADGVTPFANYSITFTAVDQDTAEAIREAGREVGVKVSFNLIEEGIYFDVIFDPNRADVDDMHISAIYATIDDPVPWITLLYKTDGYFNDIFYPVGNDQVDDFIDQFMLSDPGNTTGRQTIADGLQNLINNELYQCVWTVQAKSTYAYNNKWENVNAYGNQWYLVQPAGYEEETKIPGYSGFFFISLLACSLVFLKVKKRKQI